MDLLPSVDPIETFTQIQEFTGKLIEESNKMSGWSFHLNVQLCLKIWAPLCSSNIISYIS